jgi:hypothetical protein
MFSSFFGKKTQVAAPVVAEEAPAVVLEESSAKKAEEEKAARMEIFQNARKETAEKEAVKKTEIAEAEKQKLVIAIIKAFDPTQTDADILAQDNFVLPAIMTTEQMKTIIEIIKSYEPSTIISLLEPTKEKEEELNRIITTIKKSTPQIPNNDDKGLFNETGIRKTKLEGIITQINIFLKSFYDRRRREHVLKEINENIAKQYELTNVGGKKRKTKKMKKTKKRKDHKKRTSCNKRS